MFIERSERRLRWVRGVFVLAGLLPCAVICSTALWRRSAAHREEIERDCERVLGIPLEFGAVRHPRPGVLRVERIRVPAMHGPPLLDVAEIDAEVSAAEVRLAVPVFHCTARAAAACARLAAEWLATPQRFARSWVVDVGEVRWTPADGDAVGQAAMAAGLHVECVADGGVRAVRIRRGSPAIGEFRIQSAVGVEGVDERDAGGVRVQCDIETPVPWSVVAAVLGSASPHAATTDGRPTVPGPDALVSGGMDMDVVESRWSGTLHGAVVGIDLAALSDGWPHRLGGSGCVEVREMRLEDGRVVACECVVSAEDGSVSRSLLDAAVAFLGWRPGVAFHSLGAEATRTFGRFGGRCRLVDGRLEVTATSGDGALLVSQGLAVLLEPTSSVSAEALAWVLAPPRVPVVPAADVSAALIGLLPRPAVETGDRVRATAAEQGGRAARPSGEPAATPRF